MRGVVVTMLALGMLVGLALPAAAGAAHRPTVTKAIAKEMTVRNLRDFAGWRKRESGYIDCNGGRIDRTTWSCRVGWVFNGGCRRGKVQVRGSHVEAGRKYYDSHLRGSKGC